MQVLPWSWISAPYRCRWMNSVSISQQLLHNAQQNDFKGYDPFDALNSKIFNKTPFKYSRLCRLAWLQLHKRLPINCRPLFLVPKKRNPKGLGLFILGMLNDYKRTADEKFLHSALALADDLLASTSDPDTWKWACWGYHFDWQARAFFVPKGKPNIITTVYVARSLYELGEISGVHKYTEAAIEAAYFIRDSLYCDSEELPFFAYIPGESALVHNASLWGAAWLAFIGSEIKDSNLLSLAEKVAESSVNAQAENGSWVYGSRPHHQFIDGFHSAYNLEALDIIRHSLTTNKYDSVIAKGMEYYRATFLEEGGAVKYYDKKRHPIDTHSVAQAVITLQIINPSNDQYLQLDSVLKYWFDALYIHKSGRFSYQQHRYWKNNVDYSRWTQAWAYYALSFYNYQNHSKGNLNETD